MPDPFQAFFGKRKQTPPIEEPIVHPLYPVCTGEELFKLPHRIKMLQDIQLLVNAPQEHFMNLYQKLIFNFAEFVQLLPHPQIKYYKYEGGLLDCKLTQAIEALHTRKNFELPIGGSKNSIIEQEALWSYSVFSTALLDKVSEQLSFYRVHLFDEEKKFIQQWQPCVKPMLAIGKFYKYWLLSASEATSYKATNMLITKQLLPMDGLAWLATQSDLFELWLAFLNGNVDAAGILKTIHDRANKKLLQDKNKNDEQLALENISLEKAKKLDAEKDTAAGEAFLNWLITGIRNKTISVNQKDSLVHTLPEGLFLLKPEIFKVFSYSNKLFPAWAVVHKQFNMLGFTKLSAQDYRFEQFFGKEEPSNENAEGLLIQDSKGLFSKPKQNYNSPFIKAHAYDLKSVYPTLSDENLKNNLNNFNTNY